MATSTPDSGPQRRLRSSSAHQRSLTPRRFSSPPPPTPPPAKRRRFSNSIQQYGGSSNNGEGDESGDASLTPCRVRRTYICKVCTFASTNPREFLFHQKELHGLKQNIRECQYCMYATIYSHKLIRHVNLVHKDVSTTRTKMSTRSEQKSPSPPKLMPNVNPMYPGSISPSTLPPPAANAPKLLPNRTTSMVLPSELEVIPVSESRIKNINSNQNKPSIVMIPSEKLTTTVKMLSSPSHSEFLSGGFAKSTGKSSDFGREARLLSPLKSTSRVDAERMEKVSQFKKLYRCTICPYVTNVKSRFTKHVRYHSMPYIKCESCDFSTPYKWNLDRHRRNHMDGTIDSEELNGEMYRCHYCSFHTMTKQSLSGHLMNHHSETSDRKRKMPMDEGDYYSESEFRDEMNDFEYDDEDEDDDEVDDDDEEEEEGRENEEMTERSKTNADKTEKVKDEPVACKTCPSNPSFGNEDELKNHFDKHHRVPADANTTGAAVRSGLIQCDLCPYKVKWVSELVRHRRVHMTEKPFECHKCTFSSRWKGDLTRHITKYHPEVQEKDVVDYIDQLLDQSMMIGGADELEVYNEDSIKAARSFANVKSKQEATPQIDYRVIGELIKGQGMKQQITAPVQLSASVQLIPTNPQPAPTPSRPVTVDGPVIRKKYQCPHCNNIFATTVAINNHMQSQAYQCSECLVKGSECKVLKHLKRASLMNDKRHRSAISLKIKATISLGQPISNEKYEQFAVFETVNTQKKPVESTPVRSPKKPVESTLVRSPKKPVESLPVRPQTTTVVPPKNKPPSPRVRSTLAKTGTNITFKCRYCQFKHTSRRTIIRHLKVHATNNKFSCGICGQSSNSKNTILRHCQVRHNVSGPIIQRDSSSAQSAKATEKEKDNKVANTNTESGEEPGFVIVTGNQEQEPAQKISPTSNDANGKAKGTSGGSLLPDKRHQCPVCPYRCRKMFDLRIHSYMHKPHKGADYKCTYCPFFVSLKGSLINHLKLHEEFEAENGTRNVGNENPNNLNSIKQQDETQQPAKESETEAEMAYKSSSGNSPVKRFTCEHCPYSTNSHTTYFYHRQFHRPSKNGIFKCIICSYSVSKLHLLHQHERVHSDAATAEAKEKQMEESINAAINASVSSDITIADEPLSFQTPATVKSIHSTGRMSKRQATIDTLPTLPRVWVHRDGVFKKMFKCRHCPHVSKKRTVIFEHEKMHSLRSLPGSKASYHCQYCNYSCMNGGILTSHMRVHKAQTATNFYINDNLDSVASSVSGAGKSRWTSTPKATARKGLHPSRLNETVEREESNIEESYEVATPLPPPPPVKKSKYLSCEFCPAKFNGMEKKSMHIKCHGADLKYKCPHCCYSVNHRPHIHRHVFVHTPEYSRKFGFSTVENTPSNSSHHSKLPQSLPGGSSVAIPDGKAFTCSQCPAVFLKESTLIYHLKMHDGNAKYKCGHCTYSVFNYSNLVRHARVHGVDLPADPPELNATGTADSSNSEGKKNDMEEETATFKCPKCPAVFDKKCVYDVHAGLHGSRQWFKCDRCDYSVKYEANLIHHRYLHGVREEDKVSPVAENTSSGNRAEIIGLEVQSEGDKSPPAPSRKVQPDDKMENARQVIEAEGAGGEVKRLFQCPKCPYTHLRKDAVQSHLKRHSSGPSEAKCPHCDYGSTMQSFLREHIKLHFDPHRLRQVEAFAHWEELEVWIRSGNHKTLIYRYALGEKLFTENDCRSEAIEELVENVKGIETPVVEDVAMADAESIVEEGSIANVGSEMDDKELEDNTEPDKDDNPEEEEMEEECDADDEKESCSKIAEQEISIEQPEKETSSEQLERESSSEKPELETSIEQSEQETSIEQPELETSSDQPEQETVSVDEVSNETDKIETEMISSPEVAEEEVTEKKIDEKKLALEEKKFETVEKESKVEVVVPDEIEQTDEGEIMDSEKEEEVVKDIEEVVEESQEKESGLVETKADNSISDLSIEIVESVEKVPVEEAKTMPVVEEMIVEEPSVVTQEDVVCVTVEDDDEKVDVEKMETEDDEIDVHECSPEGEAAAALKAMAAAEEPVVVPELTTDNVTEEVIEEGTVSMDDMISSDDVTLTETCTHA
ncbi:hypothetical protein CHUAL_003996 [Chamberlinius hualienensis]